MNARILVVDDEPQVCALFCDSIHQHGWVGEQAHSGAEAVLKASLFDPDVVLLDMLLGDTNGLEVLRELLQARPGLAVIVMSGASSVALAVEAMKAGAFHYLAKPFTFREVETLLNKALESQALRRELESLRREQAQRTTQGLAGMVGESRAMQAVKATLAKVAVSPATIVLIQGETGTGKEVAARALHFLSANREGPFVAVNCSAIPEHLVESELFGHERGAFTDAKATKRGLLEEAANGTFFLDEIADLPLALQAKLLRVLEQRVMRPVGGTRDVPVTARVVAATNRNLHEAVAGGLFREDVYYRLQVMPIYLPPLRERLEDLQPLLTLFLQQFAEEFKRPPLTLTPENLERLKRYPWPGNAREVRNCAERAMLLGLPEVEQGNDQLRTHLRPAAAAAGGTAAAADEEWFLRLKSPALADVERELILKVLERCAGSKAEAAALLGINRTTLYRKLAQYGLPPANAEPEASAAAGGNAQASASEGSAPQASAAEGGAAQTSASEGSASQASASEGGGKAQP